MTLPTIFGEFRVVADPELRFTPSGKAVGSIRLVANRRKKQDDGSWADDKVVWLRGSIWDQAAENMVESISKSDLVEVRGQLETQEYEKDGEKKQSFEILIDSITPSIKYATAKVTKVERSGGGGGSTSGSTSSGGASAPVEDPWATPASDEPPF